MAASDVKIESDTTQAKRAPQIRLFTAPGCGWAKRNYAALLEKRLQFTLVLAKDNNGTKTAEFMALTPHGLTPVLVADRNALWDSLYINYFIDERFDGPALLPDCPAQRTRARLWMHHCDQVMFPLVNALARNPSDETHEALQRNFELLARWKPTGDHRYWSSDRIGLVDLCFSTLFSTIALIQTRMQGYRLPIPSSLLPWRDAIEEHPVVRQATELDSKLKTVESEIEVS
jgi:glutathione S-transferase